MIFDEYAMNKIVFFLLLIGIISIISCNDKLEMFRKYHFELEVMPFAKKIAKGETIEIRCRLIREGIYKGAKFFIRYFQTDGKGTLKLHEIEFKPNDRYQLNDDVFRLYYTSQSTDQQVFDVYIEDNFGQVIQKNFSFTDDSGQKDND